MAKLNKRNIKFDENSLNMLLQEIYSNTHNINSKIVRLYNKWEIKIRDNSEIISMGDTIIKLIAAEAKNQDQKITLLRYLKEAVFDKKYGNANPNDEPKLTNDRRNELLEMINRSAKK